MTTHFASALDDPPVRRHPDLTVTETGCHVWRGTSYPACFEHGTENCCLISHLSPAAQRAHDQPRCDSCQRFMPSSDPYASDCGRWECTADA